MQEYIKLNSFRFTPKSREEIDAYNDLRFFEMSSNELVRNKKDYMQVQPNITKKHRILLLEWIMENCYLIGFKHRTYYTCQNYFDLYLSKTKKIITEFDIQLIGVTCLFMAAKYEEVLYPNLKFFKTLCNNKYSSQQIIEMEKEILITLKMKINYNYLTDWANYLANKWDSFILRNIENGKIGKNIYPLFKNDYNYEDQVYINYYHILDFITFDYYYNFKNPKCIALAVMYYLIGIIMQLFTFEDVIANFHNRKLNHNEIKTINNYFSFFVDICHSFCGCTKDELVEALEYTYKFFSLNFNYLEHPTGIQPPQNKNEELELQKFNINYKKDIFKLICNKKC